MVESGYYEKIFLIKKLFSSPPGHSRTVDMGMWAGEERRGDAKCGGKTQSSGTRVRWWFSLCLVGVMSSSRAKNYSKYLD